MAMFLEEQFPQEADYGSGFSAEYSNQIVTTAGGDEYRSQRHPFVKATLTIEFERQTNFVVDQIIDLNNRAGGTLRGFRVLHPIDYSSNSYSGVPTAFDQLLPLANPAVAGVYQLTRWYGDSSNPACARRRIRKPQAGTVLVSIGSIVLPSAQWSVSSTTGLVSMAVNKSRSITSITQASSAVIEVGANTFAIGETVAISGVSGMTQINGLRGTITAKPDANRITVNINSSAFTTYVSGGTVQTQPIPGEVLKAGFKFHVPMRFNADLGGNFSQWDTLATPSIQLLEILNP
ncbi:DUF2460 domain-containing protein [Ectopseudomonas composti]|uniref:DUF2460 domain-containing protein n=1 Tax=Ectopseudomonas composti TaxID=658457 RepID=UPI0009E9CFA7|nr:DUF2460 domain-containing protein [Pseudomonas composti]